MSKLIVVANRLPITIRKRAGSLEIAPSPGGLATGLNSLPAAHENLWVGWPGLADDKLTKQDKEDIARELVGHKCRPVFLSQRELSKFYYGFCNKTIWPLFHYFPLNTVYEERYWEVYRQINQKFCDELLELAGPEDRFWIHDYQLMLLPQMIRQRLPDSQIGFFLHIPFPSFELFRLLPWRKEILEGLLGADLIGFHTYDYVRHFLSSVCRLTELDHTMGELSLDNRVVKVDAFPMGIDYDKYAQSNRDRSVLAEMEKLHKKVGDHKAIISIDRLDYTKGILERLEAFNLFLSTYPEYKNKVILILLVVPSRSAVDDYMDLRNQLEGLVSKINGVHGSLGWVPVWYLYRSLPFEQLSALYHIANVALVTPLRDGMNLVAKEYVACKTAGRGVLILSEMAGTASELGEAIIVNANDRQAVMKAIKEALEMPIEEQIKRNQAMQQRLSRYTVSRWAHDFFTALGSAKEKRDELAVRKLRTDVRDQIVERYRSSRRRLILLDYDGTLVGFVRRPEDAAPDDELCRLLTLLAKDSRNEIVIISGRDKNKLTQWLGDVDVNLVAEHGAWVRRKAKEWEVIEPLSNAWKMTIRPILEMYMDRTPGSTIEEKDFALVWHYRRSAPELAYVRTQELRDTILDLTTNLDIGAFEGNKVLEVKNIGINKGRAVEEWLLRQDWDFILAAGDDYTDEDMFAVLPDQAYSLKVRSGPSKAKFTVDSPKELRELITNMLGEGEDVQH